MNVLVRLYKLICDVLKGLFYLFLDLNLPQLRKQKEAKEVKDDGKRKLFECPGCQDIPLPPIYTCSSGHIVCALCKDELNNCPVCNGDYSGNARNYIVEQLISQSKFPCRFYEEGCEEVMGVIELINHQSNCYYRHCRCGIVSTNCDGNWIGSIESLYAHLLVSHEMFFIFRNKKASFKIELEPTTNGFKQFVGPTVMLKVLQGKNYVIRTMFVEEQNIIFTYVVGLYRDEDENEPGEDGSSNNATSLFKRNTASIRVIEKDSFGTCKKESITPELGWIGPINTVDDDGEDIMEEGNGLFLPWSSLTRISTTSSDVTNFLTWDLQIDIFPKPEPVRTKGSVGAETFNTKDFQQLLYRCLKPFLKSTWTLVAPTFTLAIILFFTFFV